MIPATVLRLSREQEKTRTSTLQLYRRSVSVREPANSTVSSPGGTSLTMLQPVQTNTEEDVPPSTQNREKMEIKQELEFDLEDYELFDFSDKNQIDTFVLKLVDYSMNLNQQN